MNLEKLFTQTQENYELIPFFIEQLLTSDIFCLGTQDQDNKIQFRVLETDDGEQAIPFFLSLETLQNDFGADVEHIMLNTRKLFEMTSGATLVLNPTSDLSKEFSAEEIKCILETENEES